MNFVANPTLLPEQSKYLSKYLDFQITYNMLNKIELQLLLSVTSELFLKKGVETTINSLLCYYLCFYIFTNAFTHLHFQLNIEQI